MNRNKNFYLNIFTCLSICFFSTTVNAGGFRTISVTGAATPGVAGNSFSSFNNPVIDRWGNVVFVADGTNNSLQGVWGKFVAGELVEYASTETAPLPTSPAEKYVGFNTSTLNFRDTGVAFRGLIDDGAGSSRSGIWHVDVAPTTNGYQSFVGKLALSGEQAAQAPPGTTYENVDVFQDNRTASGFGSFVAELDNGPSDSLGARAIYQDAFGVREIARGGKLAPGLSDGRRFTTRGVDQPAVSRFGHVAFRGRIEQTAGGSQFGPHGIWTGNPYGFGGPVTLAPIAIEGDSAPGNTPDVVFDSIDTEITINDHGEVLFAARLAGSGIDDDTDDSAWLQTSSGLNKVFQAGEPAPGVGTGVVYDREAQPGLTLNNAGHVTLTAFLRGPGVDPLSDEGLWADRGNGLELVAREGDSAPGLPGLEFAGFDSNRPANSGFSYNATNESGQIVFKTDLRGTGITLSNRSALWLSDPDEGLQLIARGGDQLQIAPGDVRTITFLSAGWRSTGGKDGLPVAFNDLGQLAFRAGFTDGSQGIFVYDPAISSIPEPTSAALLLMAIACVGARRK